jgi:hypothetical protein
MAYSVQSHARRPAQLVAMASLLLGCGADGVEETGEEEVQQGASTYFVARTDPGGGFLMSRVNRSDTRCGDGTMSAACHVDGFASRFQTELLPFVVGAISPATDDATLLLRGRLDGSTFRISEMWHAPAAIKLRGTFFKVHSFGQGSLNEIMLNTEDRVTVQGVDFSAVTWMGPTDRRHATDQGFLGVGTNVVDGSRTTLTLSQAFRRL